MWIQAFTLAMLTYCTQVAVADPAAAVPYAKVMTYDEYLANNFRNQDMVIRIADRQLAFVEPTRQATMIMPGTENNTPPATNQAGTSAGAKPTTANVNGFPSSGSLFGDSTNRAPASASGTLPMNSNAGTPGGGLGQGSGVGAGLNLDTNSGAALGNSDSSTPSTSGVSP